MKKHFEKCADNKKEIMALPPGKIDVPQPTTYAGRYDPFRYIVRDEKGIENDLAGIILIDRKGRGELIALEDRGPRGLDRMIRIRGNGEPVGDGNLDEARREELAALYPTIRGEYDRITGLLHGRVRNTLLTELEVVDVHIHFSESGEYQPVALSMTAGESWIWLEAWNRDATTEAKTLPTQLTVWQMRVHVTYESPEDRMWMARAAQAVGGLDQGWWEHQNHPYNTYFFSHLSVPLQELSALTPEQRALWKKELVAARKWYLKMVERNPEERHGFEDRDTIKALSTFIMEYVRSGRLTPLGVHRQTEAVAAKALSEKLTKAKNAFVAGDVLDKHITVRAKTVYKAVEVSLNFPHHHYTVHLDFMGRISLNFPGTEYDRGFHGTSKWNGRRMEIGTELYFAIFEDLLQSKLGVKRVDLGERSLANLNGILGVRDNGVLFLKYSSREVEISFDDVIDYITKVLGIELPF